MQKDRAIIATILALACLAPPVAPLFAVAKTPADKYVRIANHYLRAGTDIRPSDYPLLARYDLVTFPAEAQIFNPDMFDALRRLNPNIIILAYVPTKSVNLTVWTDELHKPLIAGIRDDWWLTNSSGGRVSVWPGTFVVNTVSGWQEHLPQFVHDVIFSSGKWDGIFYDEFSTSASWINGGDIDLHRDGVRDDPELANAAWKRASLTLLRRTRELLGPEAVIITNGDSDRDAAAFLNGRMFESFPTPWEGRGRWQDTMANYFGLERTVGYPETFVINANTGNTGTDKDYRKVRYGLASTLLGDGYFNFTFGDSSHGQLWYYDEYDARLGAPLAGPADIAAPNRTWVDAGVWRRDFERGTVLVNATDSARTVAFNEELEKIRGTQDPTTNDGSLVTSVTIPARDGLLLLKPLETISGSPFVNGSFVTVYDVAGNKKRNGFFSYDAAASGGARVIETDVDDDGRNERIAASGGVVRIYGADGAAKATFAPYGNGYRGEVRIAVGNVVGDSAKEIVTGAGPGGGPHVRVFGADGRPLTPGFFAFDPASRGGVTVAVADTDTSGHSTIIAGAGRGLPPLVRLFDGNGRQKASFLAYDPRFRGGVNVAAGDITNDGQSDIVTGAGKGGGPHVRMFNARGTAYGKGFFAGDPASRDGVEVGVATLGGGGASILAMIANVFRLADSGR